MMGNMAAQLKSLILGAIDAIDVDARYDAHNRMHEMCIRDSPQEER